MLLSLSDTLPDLIHMVRRAVVSPRDVLVHKIRPEPELFRNAVLTLIINETA